MADLAAPDRAPMPVPAREVDAGRSQDARLEAMEGRPEFRSEGDHERRLNARPAVAAQRRAADRLAGRATAQPRPVQSAAKPNLTGLPDRLKSGIEALSGLSLAEVRVFYNSSRPTQLGAHAYARGSHIHLAPGQEHHLPHEAWHVVQQSQGRVQPTAQLEGGIPVNGDAGLEREADIMGARALHSPPSATLRPRAAALHGGAVVQGVWRFSDKGVPWVNDGQQPIDSFDMPAIGVLTREELRVRQPQIMKDAREEAKLADNEEAVEVHLTRLFRLPTDLVSKPSGGLMLPPHMVERPQNEEDLELLEGQSEALAASHKLIGDEAFVSRQPHAQSLRADELKNFALRKLGMTEVEPGRSLYVNIGIDSLDASSTVHDRSKFELTKGEDGKYRLAGNLAQGDNIAFVVRPGEKDKVLAQQGGQHSVLSEGKPVYYAGTLHIEEGVLKSWNNNTGHHLTDESNAVEQTDISSRVRELLPTNLFVGYDPHPPKPSEKEERAKRMIAACGGLPAAARPKILPVIAGLLADITADLATMIADQAPPKHVQFHQAFLNDLTVDRAALG
jgi:hypothetical protein